jgi:undecaprenyl-diphosphatase
VFVDRWVLDLVGPSGTGALTGVTGLRYPQVIVAGSVIAAVVAFPTDRLRSLACLVGPPLALVTCELVVKPLVGRHLGGGLSYPSGSTVGAAALATAAALAVPARWRPVTLVVGAAYTLWMGVAVVALQWHFPTDAVAGMAYGVGVVLVVDGGLWRGTTALAGRRSRPTASGRG